MKRSDFVTHPVDNQYLSLLLEISATWSGLHNLSLLVQNIADRSVELLKLGSAAIYLIEGEYLQLKATCPMLPESTPPDARTARLGDHPHILTAIETKKPIILPDTRGADLTPAEKTICDLRALRSLLYLPLFYQDRGLGVLILGSINRVHSFSSQEVAVGTILANQAALKIEETSLYEANQRQIRDLKKGMKKLQKTQEALKSSEELLRIVLENSLDGINLLDLKTGYYTYVSPAQVELTGFSAEEMNLFSDVEALARVHPEDREISESLKRKIAAGEQLPATAEYRWKVKSGEYRWFSDSRKLVRDEQGKPVALVGISRDITEQKRVEQALREGEANIKAIVSNTPDIIFVQDRNLKYTLVVNPQLGMTAEGMIGKTDFDLLPQEEAERLTNVKSRVMATGVTEEFETSLTSRSGGQEVFEGTYVPKYDHLGQVDGLVGYFRNVTDRKRLEIQLQELLLRYEAILASVPDIIMEVDNRKVYTWANRAGMDFFGDDVVGREAANYFVGEQDTHQVIQPLFEGEEETIFVENWQRRRDGEKRLLAWWCRTLKDAAGNVIGALSTARDITEHHLADLVMRVSEEKFRSFFQTAKVGYSMTSPAGEISVNQAYADMLGYELEELAGKTWQELTPAEEIEPTRAVIQSMLDGEGDEARLVKRYIHKNGSYVWGDVSYALRRAPDGSPLHIITTVFNISKRKKAEEDLARSREQLRALNQYLLDIREQERAAIAREIHDELGQSLTAMKMDLAWLSRLESPDHSSCVQKLADLTQLVDGTIQTVRRVASELRPSILDDLGLVPALEWLAEQFQDRYGIPIQLDLAADDSLSQEVKTALFRIAQEACTNISRHARATEVCISLREDADCLELIIQDNGQGITSMEGDSPRSFGLIGMRERAQNLGGALEIEGKPGKGTTIRVRLPRGERVAGEET